MIILSPSSKRTSTSSNRARFSKEQDAVTVSTASRRRRFARARATTPNPPLDRQDTLKTNNDYLNAKKKLDEVTAKLQLVQHEKQSLQQIVDSNNLSAKDKDQIIDNLEQRLGLAELELGEQKQKTREATSREEDNDQLRSELEKARSERDKMESDLMECKERLETKDVKAEEWFSQYARRDLENENALIMAESQLSSALSEKQALEDQVIKLRHELSLQSSAAEDSRSRLEALTKQYEEDRSRYQQTEATQIRLQQENEEIESLKTQQASNIRELADSRSAIATLTKQRDEERLHYQQTESKQLSMQSSLRRENELLKNDNDHIKSRLETAQIDIASIKSVRNKDIEMLESELEKTSKHNLELEIDLKETKRQLQSAVRSLDVITLDGGKMRSDLESVMSDFAREKETLLTEITQLKARRESNSARVDKLMRENQRHENKSRELREDIEALENRLKKTMDYNEQLKKDQDRRESEIRSNEEGKRCEIDHLKSELSRMEALQQNVKDLEEELKKTTEHNKHLLEDRDRRESEMRSKEEGEKQVLQHEIACLKSNLTRMEDEARAASQKMTTNYERKLADLQLQVSQNLTALSSYKQDQDEKAAELSRAHQAIQIHKSKERYLESRVESLATQIADTVQDYEMRLAASRSGEE
ncbi:hypothetical protein THAOC_01293 [Thalassiosira oceanica]|uniref:Uncharacterized protein n=1 Tax=Thalassiosira oceanica TaxID=159749 RepID=K0THI7_THAOC|nr:hypothetical protein THAOC_01293 [Thalassiosira oceanica]|eukprot:EJK76915.1 hypothetical protein THAOC_01293 [Thalassiosira oceanica]